MAKFKRRQVLLAAMTTGVAATLTTESLRNRARQQQQAELEVLAETQRNSDNLLQQAFQQDAATIKQVREITAALRLTPPNRPYSREISKLLIQCNKIASQQYLKGKIDPSYDGTIQSLPAYSPQLDRYRQVAAFKGVEAEVNETVEVEIPVAGSAMDPVQQKADQAKETIQDTVKKAVDLRRRIPVYFGFVLSSDTDTIMLFRGTQRNAEWIDNLLAFQQDYRVPDAKQYYGKTHEGFAAAYQQILDPLPANVARQLNPDLPCYISGHSLGGALSTLAAIDIALNAPQLRSQLQLYTYASPRVGDPTFAAAHSQLIPNSYRVVNLADVIPLVPPTKLQGIYAHIGQEWAFLSQNGDVLPNHVVDTYRTAIDRELESDTANTYLNVLYGS